MDKKKYFPLEYIRRSGQNGEAESSSPGKSIINIDHIRYLLLPSNDGDNLVVHFSETDFMELGAVDGFELTKYLGLWDGDIPKEMLNAMKDLVAAFELLRSKMPNG